VLGIIAIRFIIVVLKVDDENKKLFFTEADNDRQVV
jgi:hypothetical protein